MLVPLVTRIELGQHNGVMEFGMHKYRSHRRARGYARPRALSSLPKKGGNEESVLCYLLFGALSVARGTKLGLSPPPMFALTAPPNRLEIYVSVLTPVTAYVNKTPQTLAF